MKYDLVIVGMGSGGLVAAEFATTLGVQSGDAVVFREHAYVHVSPGSSVPGESSAPEASAFPVSCGGPSQLGSVTWTESAGKGSSPGLVTEIV